MFVGAIRAQNIQSWIVAEIGTRGVIAMWRGVMQTFALNVILFVKLVR